MDNPPLPSEILDHLDAIIIEQNENKKKLALGLYSHYFRLYLNVTEAYQGKQPNNFFLLGPDGYGKEKLFSTIVTALKVPHTIYDCKEIRKFDFKRIVTKLWESALLLRKDDVPTEVDMQRSIVFLDNFQFINCSFKPDLCELAKRLQLEFDTRNINVQTKNLLFLCVCKCSDEFNQHKNDIRQFINKSISTTMYGIKEMIENTYSCIYMTTQDIDMVEPIEPSNEIFSRYRQDFAFHNVTLEFTRDAVFHMRELKKDELNDILDQILPLAMWEIIGFDKNAVQVTLDSLKYRQCPLLYKKET